jgi:hypothetical protein
VKVQCELCREIVPLVDFRPSAAGIDIGCPACGQRYFVPAPSSAGAVAPLTLVHGDGEPVPALGRPAAGPRDADAFACPKCGRTQPRAAACRYCGLVYDNWEPGPTEAGGDETARALYAQAEGAWQDPAGHDAFVEHCAAAGLLAFAARCYRARLATDPADPVARAQQQRIIHMAEVTYLAPAREARDAPLPHRTLLLGALGLLFLALVALLTLPLWRWW